MSEFYRTTSRFDSSCDKSVPTLIPWDESVETTHVETNWPQCINPSKGTRPAYEQLIAHRERIEIDQTVESAARRFQELRVDYLPVTRDGALAGVLPKSRLTDMLGSRFSFALYAGKPISMMRIEELTAFHPDCDVIPLLQHVFSRPPSRFQHDVALLDTQGAYQGMIPVQSLAMLQTKLLCDQLQELEVARDAALESTRAKSRFMATVSHELRTPLNGILGFADLLLDDRLETEQRDYIRTIRESGESLLEIVEKVIEISRLDQTTIAPINQTFLLGELLNELAADFAPEARIKNLSLVLSDRSTSISAVFGDRARLRQCLAILIGNAIKFTQAGCVRLSFGLREVREGREATIDVSDTGVGIPESHLPNLFTPFSQADASDSRRFGGMGLSLCLCRRLVEVMGGTLAVESKTGVGSTFRIAIPLAGACDQTCLRAA